MIHIYKRLTTIYAYETHIAFILNNHHKAPPPKAYKYKTGRLLASLYTFVNTKTL